MAHGGGARNLNTFEWARPQRTSGRGDACVRQPETFDVGVSGRITIRGFVFPDCISVSFHWFYRRNGPYDRIRVRFMWITDRRSRPMRFNVVSEENRRGVSITHGRRNDRFIPLTRKCVNGSNRSRPPSKRPPNRVPWIHAHPTSEHDEKTVEVGSWTRRMNYVRPRDRFQTATDKCVGTSIFFGKPQPKRVVLSLYLLLLSLLSYATGNKYG